MADKPRIKRDFFVITTDREGDLPSDGFVPNLHSQHERLEMAKRRADKADEAAKAMSLQVRYVSVTKAKYLELKPGAAKDLEEAASRAA